MIKIKKYLTWLAFGGLIAGSLFGLSHLIGTNSAQVLKQTSSSIINQNDQQTVNQAGNAILTKSQSNHQLVNDHKEVTDSTDQVEKTSSSAEKEAGLVIIPFKGYTALVDLGDYQLSEAVEIPQAVNFVRKNAFQNSQANFVNFCRNGTVKIAGGAQLPTNAQYSVYDDETAKQLIGVGVVGIISIRSDETKMQVIDGLIYKFSEKDSTKTLVGLSSSGQEASELIIPHDISLITEGALDHSQATLIKLKSSEPICFRGSVPNAEYEIENVQTAINLIRAGAKQNIVLRSKKFCITENEIKSLVFDFSDGQIILVGLKQGTQGEETLQIPTYVDQIAAGAFDQFKGKTIFFPSLKEVVLHGKVPSNFFYYSRSKKMVNRLVKAGAPKERTFWLVYYEDSKSSIAAIVVSVLAGLAVLASLGWIGFYIYKRKKKAKVKPEKLLLP